MTQLLLQTLHCRHCSLKVNSNIYARQAGTDNISSPHQPVMKAPFCQSVSVITSILSLSVIDHLLQMALAFGKAVRWVMQTRLCGLSAPVSTQYSSLANNHKPSALRQDWPKPSFNMEKMTEILDHDNLNMRQEMREFLRDPVFTPK